MIFTKFYRSTLAFYPQLEYNNSIKIKRKRIFMRENHIMNGISFANPVEIDAEYCNLALDYALRRATTTFNG
jgi:hypothetical protein